MKNYSILLLSLLISIITAGQNILISEDFLDGVLPVGWSQQSNASDGGWLLGNANQLESQYWDIANHGKIIATNDDACDCNKSMDYLILSPLDLSSSAAVTLSFDNFYDEGNLDGDFENAFIEYSLDNGVTWQILEEIFGSVEGQWDTRNVDLSSLTGNSNVLVAFRYDDDGGWLFGWALDNVMVFEPVGLDLELSNLTMDIEVNPNSSQVVSGVVTNVGAETISSFELSWQSGTDVFSQTFSNVNLAASQSYTFQMTDELFIPSSGTFEVNVTIENVNGGISDDNSANDSLSASITVLDSGSILSGGIVRDYIYYHPSDAPDNCPIVFVCHGYTGTAEGIRGYSQFNEVADEFGFAVCYPQGIEDSSGNTFFNVDYDFQNNETVDDVAFLLDLNTHLQSNNSLNPERVYCTGLSNGGDFCYLLACEAGDTFSAVAPVAGFFKQSIIDNCTLPYPVSVLEIHGTNDNVTYYNGDPNNNDNWGAYPSIPDAIDFLVINQDLELLEEYDAPNINTNDGSTVSIKKYGHLDNCLNVWLYTVNGGGHDWPGAWGNMDIDSSREIWNFFDYSCTSLCNNDTEAPSFTMTPADIIIECDNGLTDFGTPEVMDTCDPNPVLVFTDIVNPGVCEGDYSISREYIASDATGNSATHIQLITFVDNNAPTITNPPVNVTIECLENLPGYETITATDNCSNIIYDYAQTDNGNGSYTFTYTASDGCGNSSFVNQLISIQDVISPVFITDAVDISFDCGMSTPEIPLVEAIDNCTALITVSYSEETIPGLGNGFTILRTWLAEDESGNQAVFVQNVESLDNCAPTPCTVDFNLNGIVDVADLVVLLGEFGCSEDCMANIDGIEGVYASDISLFLQFFGSSCE